MELTQEFLKSSFKYVDGWLYWKIKPAKSIVLGSKAGTLNSKGYFIVTIEKNKFRLHRLIFLYHHGWMPEYVDHRDRDINNCKIENLRAATHKQNMQNSSSRKNSTSKYLGVSFSSGKWVAQIKIGGKNIFIGRFKEEDQAALSYNKLALQYHGEFANLNIVTPI